MIYAELVSRVTPEGRLRIDALLGDVAAQAEIEEQRSDAVALSGFEVG